MNTKFDYSAIPAQLRAIPQYVLWHLGPINPATGRPKKIPTDASGKPIDCHQPQHWLSFAAALDAIEKSDKADGIGLVLTQDAGVSCLDIDSASQLNGTPARVVSALGTWAETSQSGDGLHLFMLGSIPTTISTPHAQLYQGGQFIALTGRVAPGTAAEIADCTATFHVAAELLGLQIKSPKKTHPEAEQAAISGTATPSDSEVLERAYSARNGAKTREIFNGGVHDGKDTSETGVLMSIVTRFAPYCESVDQLCRVSKQSAHYSERWELPAGNGKTQIEYSAEKAFLARNFIYSPAHNNKTLSADSEELALIRDEKGKLVKCLANMVEILTKHKEWAKVIGYNEFSGKIEKRKNPPYNHGKVGDWEDFDDSAAANWFGVTQNLHVSGNQVNEAKTVAARANGFHPVREYLNNIVWDGEYRLSAWVSRYLGCDSESAIEQAFGYLWIISAVARVFDPGCKADHVLILEGEQGIGKSTALQVLGGDWFTDSPFEIGSKDSFLALRGHWIVEIAELDTFNRADSNRAKAFFSARIDDYREPYGRNTISVPRQCVFAGTVNGDNYLKDSTGNRRYWPINCTAIDIDALKRDRDQLFAEAVSLYKSEEKWWIDTDIPGIKEHIDMRYQADAWEELIEIWLQAKIANESPRKPRVALPDIMEKCLDIPRGQFKRADEMKVSSIIRRCGWEKVRTQTADGARAYLYQPK
jgi:predicted P-loop ATPase